MYTHRFALHPLRCQRAGGNGGATAKGFEPGIHNLPLVIDLNLSKSEFLKVLLKFQTLPSFNKGPILHEDDRDLIPKKLQVVISFSNRD